MQEAKMNTPEEFFDKVRDITRKLDMNDYIEQLTARQIIEMISNDYVELSHDKMRMQAHDHIRWCKKWLELNKEDKAVQDCIEAIQMTMSRGIRDDYYRGQYDAVQTIKKRFNIE